MQMIQSDMSAETYAAVNCGSCLGISAVMLVFVSASCRLRFMGVIYDRDFADWNALRNAPIPANGMGVHHLFSRRLLAKDEQNVEDQRQKIRDDHLYESDGKMPP